MKLLIAKIAAWILGIFTLGLISVCVVDQVLLRVEAARLRAPGIMVNLGEGRLHVVSAGGGGKTIVLMPGLGATAPWLDYQDLVQVLAARYRVAMVEPFGYGWSDGSTLPRTAEAIVDETRAALRLADIPPPYILMPHSISGLYSLDWAKRHPEELLGVVGLDTSAPGQTAYTGLPVPDTLLSVAHVLGWVRVYLWVEELLSPSEPGQAAKPEINQALFKRNIGNSTVRNETDMASNNFQAASTWRYPPELPVRLLLASDMVEASRAKAWKEDWIQLHTRLFTAPGRQKVQVLKGSHFISQGNEAAIAEILAAMLTAK